MAGLVAAELLSCHGRTSSGHPRLARFPMPSRSLTCTVGERYHVAQSLGRVSLSGPARIDPVSDVQIVRLYDTLQCLHVRLFGYVHGSRTTDDNFF